MSKITHMYSYGNSGRQRVNMAMKIEYFETEIHKQI